MVALTTNVGQLLKEVYGDTVHDLINSRDQVFGMIQKDYDEDGELLQLAHRTGDTGSMGFQSQTGTLPTANQQSYENSVITPKEWWGTGALSMRLIKQSKTRRGAFLKGLEGEMKGFIKTARKFFEIRALGDGSGTIADGLSDVGTDDELTLANVEDARKFSPGMILEAFSARTRGATQKIFTTGVNTAVVSSIDLDAGKINFSTTVGEDYDESESNIATTDVLTVAGARTPTVRNEMMGLDGIVDNRDTPMEDIGNSGTGFQQIASPYQYGTDRTSLTSNTTPVALWASTVLHGSGTNRPITDKILQQAQDGIEIRGNGRVDYYITPFGVRLEYAISQLNVRRNMNTISLAGQTGGGFKEDPRREDFVEYGGYPIVPNRFCRKNTVYACDWSSFKIKYWARQQFWDDDGSVLRKDPDRKPELQFEQYAYLEMVCTERNANARIEDITGTDAA